MLAFSRGVGWRRAPEPPVKTTKADSWPKGPTKELFDELGRIETKRVIFFEFNHPIWGYETAVSESRRFQWSRSSE